jgi:hypothetical protein
MFFAAPVIASIIDAAFITLTITSNIIGRAAVIAPPVSILSTMTPARAPVTPSNSFNQFSFNHFITNAFIWSSSFAAFSARVFTPSAKLSPDLQTSVTETFIDLYEYKECAYSLLNKYTRKVHLFGQCNIGLLLLYYAYS